MEALRRRDKTTRLVFPMISKTGNIVSGCAGMDSKYVQYSDNADPVAFADCFHEAQEIGVSGMYYLIVRNDEVDVGYTAIVITTSTPNVRPQVIMIRTYIPLSEELAGSVWDELLESHQLDDTFGRIVQEIHYHSYMDREIVFATDPVVDQGITQEMIDYGTPGVNQGIIQYEIVRVAIDRDWGDPDFTFYVLWHYDANGRCNQKKASMDTTW